MTAPLGSVTVPEIVPLTKFWPAEGYHQDYSAKNPNQGYCMALFDGTFRYAAWVRSDGCNIDGMPDVPMAFPSTSRRRVVLWCRNGECRLSVDGEEVQRGLACGITEQKKRTLLTIKFLTSLHSVNHFLASQKEMLFLLQLRRD